MASKRPAKLKSSIAKLNGVERDRAIHADDLITNHEYARESADLLAFLAYPLDDGVTTSREFANEVASLSMDVCAFAETSTPGAAVHAAAMAIHAMKLSADSHNEAHYIKRLDRMLVDLPSIEARFGD